MELNGTKLVVIGGAGLIGSHTVDRLLKEDVKEIVIYDNFVRGRAENLHAALKDPRVKIFDVGGDIMQTDILEAALEGADGVFHFAALWLLQCHEYPAQRVRRQRARHLQCDGSVRQEGRQAPGLFIVGIGLRRRRARADGRGPPVQQQELLRRDQDRGRGDAARLPPPLRAQLRRPALHERLRPAPGLPRRLHRRDHEDARRHRSRARGRRSSATAARRSTSSRSRTAAPPTSAR